MNTSDAQSGRSFEHRLAESVRSRSLRDWAAIGEDIRAYVRDAARPGRRILLLPAQPSLPGSLAIRASALRSVIRRALRRDGYDKRSQIDLDVDGQRLTEVRVTLERDLLGASRATLARLQAVVTSAVSTLAGAGTPEDPLTVVVGPPFTPHTHHEDGTGDSADKTTDESQR